GLVNGLLIYFGYRKKHAEEDSVIAAVHKQKGRLPLKTLPIKPLAAVVTLASGGSAGKEGPCSHIGGTLASWLGRIMHLSPRLQRKIVACGVSAGFASVLDRKSTRLNSSHVSISYAVFCLKKKRKFIYHIN